MSWREAFQEVFGADMVAPTVQPDTPAWRWRITWPNDQTMEVHYAPPATHAQVAGDYPGARVEPVPEPVPEPPSGDLYAALVEVCRDLPVIPEAVLEALAPEDLADWQAGRLPVAILRTFAHCLPVRASAAE